jgi:hypothetical protein
VGDSSTEFAGVLTLAYVVPLFYRAELFLKRHCWSLQVTSILAHGVLVQEPCPATFSIVGCLRHRLRKKSGPKKAGRSRRSRPVNRARSAHGSCLPVRCRDAPCSRVAVLPARSSRAPCGRPRIGRVSRRSRGCSAGEDLCVFLSASTGPRFDVSGRLTGRYSRVVPPRSLSRAPCVFSQAISPVSAGTRASPSVRKSLSNANT